MLQNYSSLQLIIFYSSFASLVLLLFGIIRYQKLSVITKHIFLLAFISSTVQIVNTILWLNKMRNMHILNLYSIIEFLIILHIYRIELKGFIKSYWIDSLAIAFVVFTIYNMFYIQGVYNINSNSKILESVLLAMLSIMYFYKVTKELVILDLKAEPMFWINAAVLIYFVSDSFVFAFSDYLQKHFQKLSIWVWAFHAMFFVLFCVLLSISFFVNPKRLPQKL